jgi:uncharacterized membrane protein
VRLGDASLAAPFTAKSPSIACVADLLRQGRASLARAQQQAQQGIAYALSNLLYHFVLVRGICACVCACVFPCVCVCVCVCVCMRERECVCVCVGCVHVCVYVVGGKTRGRHAQ